MKHFPPVGATQRARRLRRTSTDSERLMWRLLRENFPHARFRRQVPLRHFIVDFASHPYRLVIEVDGGQHDNAADSARTAIIADEGYVVIRFWNNEVLCNSDGVLAAIDGALRDHHPHPNPPPSRGRGHFPVAESSKGPLR
jgi:very-short-patch-repair endonuclease